MRNIKKTVKTVISMVMILALVLGFMPELSVSAANAESDSRLSVNATKLWLNGPGKLEITLKNHTEKDILNVWTSDADTLKIKVGKWKGDVCKVTLTPKATKNISLVVEAGGETKTVKLYMTELNKMSSEEIYEYAHDAAVVIETMDRSNNIYMGAGFFIGNGLILTNHHVVEAAKSIKITDYNGKEYKIKSILGYDETKDLILIQVSKTNTASLSIADSAKGGQRIYSYGNPCCITATFVQGIIANPHVEISENNYIQLAMPSGVGSGGGPIIDEYGHVVGVMCLVVKAAQNMSFAVDYATINKFLDEVKSAESITLKQFIKTTKGKTKESNFYDIIGSSTADNTSVIYTGMYSEMSGEDIYEKAHDAMVSIVVDTYIIYTDGTFEYGEYTVGSGFFISEDTIVTNHHVLTAGGQDMRAKDYSGHVYHFVNVKTSSDYDLGVVTVTCDDGLKKHTWLDILPNYIPAGGETVYTFGNPAGYLGTFADGVVSSSTRNLSEYVCDDLDYARDVRFINFTAPIAHGSSGGPLINKYGMAIGVNSVMIDTIEENNYAIQIDQLSNVK